MKVSVYCNSIESPQEGKEKAKPGNATTKFLCDLSSQVAVSHCRPQAATRHRQRRASSTWCSAPGRCARLGILAQQRPVLPAGSPRATAVSSRRCRCATSRSSNAGSTASTATPSASCRRRFLVLRWKVAVTDTD